MGEEEQEKRKKEKGKEIFWRKRGSQRGEEESQMEVPEEIFFSGMIL